MNPNFLTILYNNGKWYLGKQTGEYACPKYYVFFYNGDGVREISVESDSMAEAKAIIKSFIEQGV